MASEFEGGISTYEPPYPTLKPQDLLIAVGDVEEDGQGEGRRRRIDCDVDGAARLI